MIAKDYEEAEKILKEGVETFEQCGTRFYLGWAHRLLGELFLKKDNKTAPYHFEKSIEILKHIKADNELARAHAGYGRFCNSEGRVEEAKEHLSKALEIFERLGTLVEPEKIREELIG